MLSTTLPHFSSVFGGSMSQSAISSDLYKYLTPSASSIPIFSSAVTGTAHFNDECENE